MFSEWFQNSFQIKNVQPQSQDSDRIPVCPHYQLIELAGLFVGMTPEELAVEPRFCGHRIEGENTLTFLAGHDGDNFYPHMACTQFRDKLTHLLHIMESTANLPDVTQVKNLNVQELESLLRLKKTQETQEQTLALWRNVVYDNFIVPQDETIDPRLVHFQARTLESLTNEEVIATAHTLLNALVDKVTGLGTDLAVGRIRLSDSADHCPQTPHFFQTGEFS